MTDHGPALRESAYLVLTALAAQPQHGYAILEDVLRISDGRVRLHTGSLYAILDRLREIGLIEIEREEIVASRLRRYYRLTGAGAVRLTEETQALRRRTRVAATRLRRFTAIHQGDGA
jgi:DNA-binding PadR family transcriptional regulator